MTLEVIDVPLSIPVLNADSFRIAPQLDEHPQRDLVRSDPYSPAAQQLVSDLVKSVHRHSQDLKENLGEEGQSQPGVITRQGKLINANTRCVLLRELAREGRTKITTLRVAVLPADVTDQELLELEMLLQQQVELKDEYRLVNQLTMIKKLHDAGVSDDAIARKLRIRSARSMSAGARVRELREVLFLMERTRRLTEPRLSITTFASDRDKEQNWRELLREVKRLDSTQGREAADAHILGWLIAYLTGIDSVHKLRLANGDWVERGVIDQLAQHHHALHDAIAGKQQGETTPSGRPDKVDQIPGLDLLGSLEETLPAESVKPQVQTLANIVAQAHQAGTDHHVTLPNGTSVSAPEVLEKVGNTVNKAIAAEKRRNRAGTRLTRPQGYLDSARSSLNDAIRAIYEAKPDPAFHAHQRATLNAMLTEIEDLVDQARTALEQDLIDTEEG
ncbi:hypothetical protein MF672_006065 [Actinomadura sp. ATCC 31491]|uniref:ParB/Sulfiredoxin domain-containing protein n=1 Tax=Actinomadura luzonensis TaxID=2805427 RepID=A0ABT0FMY0_9ACTN|nr:hypothetical protein [Actinomadura luzonensis]MCK2213360.1 hypothetical protein [Actinomadura luzonensis]